MKNKGGASRVILMVIIGFSLLLANRLGANKKSTSYTNKNAYAVKEEIKPEQFIFEEWCKKFADLEGGGEYYERQFFLILDYLDSKFPDTTLEKITTNTFVIWSDSFKSAGYSSSYYDFLRTFKEQVEKSEGFENFDDSFYAYCVALLASVHFAD